MGYWSLLMGSDRFFLMDLKWMLNGFLMDLKWMLNGFLMDLKWILNGC